MQQDTVRRDDVSTTCLCPQVASSKERRQDLESQLRRLENVSAEWQEEVADAAKERDAAIERLQAEQTAEANGGSDIAVRRLPPLFRTSVARALSTLTFPGARRGFSKDRVNSSAPLQRAPCATIEVGSRTPSL